MSGERSRFAGGDQQYLRDEQYASSDRLAARAHLHQRWSTATTDWYEFVARWIDVPPRGHVLEVGCGAGWLWERARAHVPPTAHLVLTDASAGMVAEAIARVTATGAFADVAGQQADAQQLPFADDVFDRVVANHMLYHLPDPERGVTEVARVMREDGLAIVATNGRRHMAELWEIRGDVFGLDPVDQTVDVFGAETGFPILRRSFGDVRWVQAVDVLRCTGEEGLTDVMAYICSTPPAEAATADERAALERAVRAAFDAGGGTFTITKDTGCFVCRHPSR